MLSLLLALGAPAPQSYTLTEIPVFAGGLTSGGYGGNEAGAAVGRSDQVFGSAALRVELDGSVTYLGTLPGGSLAEAWAANEAGVVVGYANLQNGDVHAFRWRNGVMEDLGTLPGGNFSQARGLNAAGDVVGYARYSPALQHAFWHDGVQMHDLGALAGGRNSAAYAINNERLAVGWSDDAAAPFVSQAVSWSPAFGIRRLPVLPGGSGEGVALAVNDLGDAAGWAITAGGQTHAVLWTGGAALDLGTLGGSQSIAHAVNERGDVVGWSATASGAVRPFLYRNGRMIDLELQVHFIDWDLHYAYAINDAGDIVGVGTYLPTGLPRGFILREIGLRLRGPAPGLAGQNNALAVSGAPPNGAVAFVHASAPGRTPVPNCANLFVDLASPVLGGVANGDAAGAAQLLRNVPAVAAGRTVWLQAVAPGACAVSNPVVHHFP